MTDYSTNPLALIAAAPMTTQQKKAGNGTWFEALADAWGRTLDQQANRIQEQSNIITNGNDTAGAITELTADSMKLGFLANSSHTSISSVSTALETMARKQ